MIFVSLFTCWWGEHRCWCWTIGLITYMMKWTKTQNICPDIGSRKLSGMQKFWWVLRATPFLPTAGCWYPGNPECEGQIPEGRAALSERHGNIFLCHNSPRPLPGIHLCQCVNLKHALHLQNITMKVKNYYKTWMSNLTAIHQFVKWWLITCTCHVECMIRFCKLWQ